MVTSAKKVTDNLRDTWVNFLTDVISKESNEVIQTAAGTLYIPVLDELGDDRWVKINVIIPKADEAEGTDGYSLGREYSEKLKEKQGKAEKAAKVKAEKIAKDEKKRAEKAKKKEEQADE